LARDVRRSGTVPRENLPASGIGAARRCHTALHTHGSHREGGHMPHDKDQTHWHEPSGNKRAGFGEFKKQPTPYDAFMESEGVPVFRDIGISKVQDLPLAPWKRKGGRGHYIQLYGTETKWGCYVVEVPPRGALNPEKHMYEEIF